MSACNDEEDQDSGYVCTLDDQSIKIAKEELFEDPKERLGAVKALRKWILEQNWLKTPTDTVFLLSFLRSKKFSQLGARTGLTNYWTVRTEMPTWFSGLDPTDKNYQEYMEFGDYLIMPGRDTHGRKVILNRPGALESETVKAKWGYEMVFRHMMFALGSALMDENVQVNGILVLVDASNYERSSAIFSLGNMTKALHCWQSSFPARYKGIHLYNQNPLYQALVAGMKPFMTEKMASRMFVHGNSLVPVYEHIEKRMLPREYLPDDYIGPCAGYLKDIIEYNKLLLSKLEVLEYAKKSNSKEYGVDLKLKPAKPDVPNASFRKLHVE